MTAPTPTRAPASASDAVVMVAEAIDRADEGYSIRLTGMSGSETEYTLDLGDGAPLKFSDIDDARDHALRVRSLKRAQAAIAAFASPPPAVPESVRRAFSEYEALPASALRWECERVAFDYVRTLLSTPSGRADTPPAGGGAVPEGWRKVLRDLIDAHDKNVCLHEEVHRGGAIWTICDHCGRKWADDEGGFQPYEEPPAVTAAWSLLKCEEVAAAPAAPESAAGGGREIVRHIPDELRRLSEGASQGEWSIWPEPIADADEAVRELASQVSQTDPVGDHLFLLNAGGKCPATTGCGPTSEANAAFIVGLVNWARSILSAPSEAETAGGDGATLKALDSSQSLLAMLHQIGPDIELWQGEGVRELLVEQITENRAVLNTAEPTATAGAEGGQHADR